MRQPAYTPWGALSGLTNGCAGSGCTNSQETYSYNNRMQPTQIQLGTSGNPGAYYTLGYNYSLPGGSTPPGCPVSASGSGNNGDVIGYTFTDAVNSTMSHSALYVYDGVNRLACAQASGNSTYNLAFGYDAYGNMTCLMNGSTNGPCPVLTYNNYPNRIDGFSYDAAGNLTSDGTNSFSWDGEGRETNSSAVYNAFGQEVYYAVPWTNMSALFAPNGDWLGNADGSSLWVDQVRAGGRKIAAYSRDNNETYLQHPNFLGSATQDTNHLGNWTEDLLWYPWGQLWQTAGNLWEWEWAAFQEGDGDFKLAPHRVYDDLAGRWLTPDPAGLAAADPSDPQTWNMYAYVRNNPTTRVDPTGLYDFKNPCEKSDKQCNADFKAFKKEFKDSLDDIKAARNSFGKGSEERARLDAVLKTYGKAGDDNGVTVTTGDLRGLGAAATVGSAVTFDMSKNPNETIMAINAGHEGTHVMDNLDPRSSTAPLPDFSFEYRGYETSAWVAQGLGLSGLSAGGYTIFTSGRGFNDAGTSNLIMGTYPRLNPGKIFVDPLPYHDPWEQQ